MIQLLQDTISTNKNEELLSHLIVPIFSEVRLFNHIDQSFYPFNSINAYHNHYRGN